MRNPCYLPIDPSGPREPQEGGPLAYSAAELSNMTTCNPGMQNCITVQQPPKVGARRFLIVNKRVIQEPKVMYKNKEVRVPHIVFVNKTCKVPKLLNDVKVVKVPRIDWQEQMVAEPSITCVQREIIEPREVCQTLLCQPRPQVIGVPEAKDFSCYYGATKPVCSGPCPPYPMPPSLPYNACRTCPCPSQSCGAGMFQSPPSYGSPMCPCPPPMMSYNPCMSGGGGRC